MAVQALVGAFVDRASGRVVRVALAESAKGPHKPLPGIPQLKDEAKRRGRCPLLAERDTELPTPWKPGAIGAHRLTPSPDKLRFPILDFSTGTFSLDASGRLIAQAPDLLRPLLVSEDERGGSELFP
jgi:hypothetical protein